FLTFTGLDRYDGYSVKSYSYNVQHPDYIMPGFFIGMAQDSSGIIWINDGNAGIYSFDPVKENFHHYVHAPKNVNSLSDDQNFGCAFTIGEKIWIPTFKGLDKLDSHSGNFTHYFHRENDSSTIANNFLTSACADEDGNLWLSSA